MHHRYQPLIIFPMMSPLQLSAGFVEAAADGASIPLLYVQTHEVSTISIT